MDYNYFGNEETALTPDQDTPSQHLVILLDVSRRMYVKLTDTEALFKWIPEGDSFDQHEWTLIPQNPTGYWESDTKFVEATGFFEQVDADNWIEQQGEGTNYFTRVSEAVILYDDNRSMYVELTDSNAYFKMIPQGQSFFDVPWTLIPQNPTGHWVSSTKFVDANGFFEQIFPLTWKEQQGDSTNYYTEVSEGVSAL